MFLPIKDAAKTSILSTNWRHRWRSIPQLVFDEEAGSESNVNKILFDIYKALLIHDGPVTEFVLAIPGLCPCYEIDLIILHLSTKGIKKLALLFGEVDDNYTPSYRMMHSSLFSAIELNYLELDGAQFVAPSWFLGFSKLTVLKLNNATLPPDFCVKFVPMCPLLEDLRIAYCIGAEHLKLVAPCLKVFGFVGYLENILFECTPLLSVLSIEQEGGACITGKEPDIAAIFGSLPALQQLYINFEFLDLAMNENIPQKLPDTLPHLRVLGINNGTGLIDPPEDCVMFFLIRSSSRLQRLTFQVLVSNELIISFAVP
ncbi:F-box/FBD/LRR-repeat protein At1g13570 [Linum grandiflorum]